MFFPLSDDDRHLLRPAWVTIGLVAINVLLFLLQLAYPDFTSGYSAIPAEITTGTDLTEASLIRMGGGIFEIPQAPGPVPIHLTLFTAMFMHAGWAHLGGNLLYLWIFGDNVEHRFGALRFLLFYLASGLAASFAQIALDPDSPIPTLGASGAISGVLGAYIVLFPKNRVNAIVFYRIVSVPAVLVLGMWIFMQFVSGYGSLIAPEQTGGVAYAAHIGGFIAGVVAGLVVRLLYKQEPESNFREVLRRNQPPPLPRGRW